MEVAVMGSRAKLGTKEGGKLNQSSSLNGVTRMKATVLADVKRIAPHEYRFGG